MSVRTIPVDRGGLVKVITNNPAEGEAPKPQQLKQFQRQGFFCISLKRFCYVVLGLAWVWILYYYLKE